MYQYLLAAAAGYFLGKNSKTSTGLGAAKCNNRVKCTGLKKDGTLKKGYRYGEGAVL
jgi:hypothetical protein